jgi:hypothetical protein
MLINKIRLQVIMKNSGLYFNILDINAGSLNDDCNYHHKGMI